MNTVTVAIESGALLVEDGALHLGELAPIAFTGYTPAAGNSIRLTVFDNDGKTPLADNHSDAAVLDLRGEKLRKAFREARGIKIFFAVATEVTSLGESTGEVLATGQLPVAWSPLVFDGETGAPASLQGPPGQDGRDGQDGAPGRDGKDLAWGEMTAEQKAALVAAVAEVLASNSAYAAALRGLPGIPGTPGVGLPGRDGKDGKDGKDGADGAPGQDGTDFAWGDMTAEQKAALAEAVAEALVSNPSFAEALRGRQGERGLQGLQGIPGPEGRRCPKGDTPDISNKADLVGGKVPADQLPSFVDDILEYASLASFPATGEEGKLYVAKDTNTTYRWSGTQYTEVSPSPTPVAPSTAASAAGKPADAKATGEQLALRPTKAQIDAGWLADKITSLPDGATNVVFGWDEGTTPAPIVAFDLNGKHYISYDYQISSDGLTITLECDAPEFPEEPTYTVTVVRYRVAAPVPTKPSDIGAQPSGDYALASSLTNYLPLTGGTLTGGLVVTNAFSDRGITLTNNSVLGSYGWRLFEALNGRLVFSRLGGDGGFVYLRKNAGIIALLSDIGIPAFSTTAFYNVGAKVIYDNALWNCTTEVATAGAWTGTTNWTKVCNLAADATPTANSANIMTSGAIRNAVRYDLGAAQVIDSEAVETDSTDPESPIDYGEATLADRTANYVQITAAIDELRLAFPAAVSGKVRDFELRVEVGTGSAALTAPAIVVVAPTGETIKVENPDRAIPTLADGTADAKGVTLLYFSENPPAGTFLVKGEVEKEVA